MLEQLGRHPYRPAHMRYIVTAAGCQKLFTLTFVGDDDYLDTDARRQGKVDGALTSGFGRKYEVAISIRFVLNPA